MHQAPRCARSGFGFPYLRSVVSTISNTSLKSVFLTAGMPQLPFVAQPQEAMFPAARIARGNAKPGVVNGLAR